MKIKYNPSSIDVVEIVKQIRQQIQLKNQDLKIEDRLKQQLQEKLIKKIDELNFPYDVKEDLKKSEFNLIFDGESLFRSERPKVGLILSLTRKIFKPLLKLVININPLIHFLHRQSYLIKLYQEMLLEALVKIEKSSQAEEKRKKEQARKSGFSRKQKSKSNRGINSNDKRSGY